MNKFIMINGKLYYLIDNTDGHIKSAARMIFLCDVSHMEREELLELDSEEAIFDNSQNDIEFSCLNALWW